MRPSLLTTTSPHLTGVLSRYGDLSLLRRSLFLSRDRSRDFLLLGSVASQSESLLRLVPLFGGDLSLSRSLSLLLSDGSGVRPLAS